MIANICETCRAGAPLVVGGPFAGSTGMHDYCEACSKNLCVDCMKNGRCRETLDRKHRPATEGEG